jgi:ABC-type phosphate transport system ATPase subunit
MNQRWLSQAASSSGDRPRAGRSSGDSVDDEPASALDPIATQRIEELIYVLKAHDRDRDAQHAAGRAGLDFTAFFWLGNCGIGRTSQIFTT